MRKVATFIAACFATNLSNAATLEIFFDIHISQTNTHLTDFNQTVSLQLDTNTFLNQTKIDDIGFSMIMSTLSLGKYNLGSLDDAYQNRKLLNDNSQNNYLEFWHYLDDIEVSHLNVISGNYQRTNERPDGTGEFQSEDINISFYNLDLSEFSIKQNNLENLLSILLKIKKTNTEAGFINQFIIGSYYGCDASGNECIHGNQIGDNYFNSGVAKITSLTLDGIEVSEVPIPASAWLMVSSLIGLAAVARRKKA